MTYVVTQTHHTNPNRDVPTEFCVMRNKSLWRERKQPTFFVYSLIGRSHWLCQFVADKRRPVLKHGPRSLTCVFVCRARAVTRWMLGYAHLQSTAFPFFFFFWDGLFRSGIFYRYRFYFSECLFFSEYVLNYRLPVLFLRFEKGNHLARGYQAYLKHTVHQQDTNRKETVKKLIQQFENHPNKESFLQDFDKTEKINTFSEESKKLITDMGSTEIFEFCETSSKKQRTRLCFIMGSWHCVLFMWETSNTFAKYQNVGQEELRRPIKSRLRHQEELLPLCQTWSFRTATNVIQSQEMPAESSPTQAWWVQNLFGKMAQDC